MKYAVTIVLEHDSDKLLEIHDYFSNLESIGTKISTHVSEFGDTLIDFYTNTAADATPSLTYPNYAPPDGGGWVWDFVKTEWIPSSEVDV